MLNGKINKSISFDSDVIEAAEIIANENGLKLSAYINSVLQEKTLSKHDLALSHAIYKRLDRIEFNSAQLDSEIIRELQKLNNVISSVKHYIKKYNITVVDIFQKLQKNFHLHKKDK